MTVNEINVVSEPTWRNRLNELSTEYGRSLDEWRHAVTDGERAAAAEQLRTTIRSIAKFLHLYVSEAYPKQDSEIASSL